MSLKGIAGLLEYDRRALVLGLAALFAETTATLANPWMAGMFTRGLLEPNGTAMAAPGIILAGWFGLLAVQNATRYAHLNILGRLGIDSVAALRMRLVEHLQYLPMAFFHDRPRGDVLATLNRDTAVISDFVAGVAVPLLPRALVFVGAASYVIYLEPTVGAAVLVLIPAYVVAHALLARRLRPLAAALTGKHADLQARLEQNLEMTAAIKSCTREAEEIRRTRTSSDELRAIETRYLRHENRLTVLTALAGAATLLGLLGVGAWAIDAGRMDAPTLVSLSICGWLLISPLIAMGGATGRLLEALASAARVRAILDEAQEPNSHAGIELGPLQTSLKLENIRFRYPDRPALLEGLDLVIPRGRRIGITGANGSGKTTLAHLMLRLLLPDAGRVTFDGQDIDACSTRSLRTQVSLVEQAVLIDDGSIADNIAFGIPRAARADIETAARMAGAWDFIIAMPLGLDTPVGPMGVKLSGGQRQRIALARALLQKPSVLILDEATSMQDAQHACALEELLEKALPDLTVLVISHRASTLALVDEIYELTGGCLVRRPGA